MTTYRNDLLSAHARIAHLEQRIASYEAEREPPTLPAPKLPPTESPKPETEEGKPIGVRFWHAWPLAALVASVATYAIRFGSSLPAWSTGELMPFERGSVGLAIVSSLLVVFAFGLRVKADGESSIGQRLLMLVAAILSAPLLILGALALLQLGSIILAIVGIGGTIIGIIVAAVSFVRGR